MTEKELPRLRIGDRETADEGAPCPNLARSAALRLGRQAGEVDDVPVLGDPPVPVADEVHDADRGRPAGRRQAEELPRDAHDERRDGPEDPREGLDGFQPSFTSLLGHLDTEGTTISTLATRTGTSRQAVSQLARSIEQAGFVERVGNARAALAGPDELGELKRLLAHLLGEIDPAGALRPE